MYIAAAEETQENLTGGRGDAYCGMLNASYNLKLRNVRSPSPARALAMGINSWILSAHSWAVPTGFSGIYAFTLRSFRL